MSVTDGDGVTNPVHEHLLAGPMFLAEHHILLAAPPFIQLTETTISVSIILPLPIFFPDQLQGQVFVSLQLPPDVGKVRQRAGELGRPADCPR